MFNKDDVGGLYFVEIVVPDMLKAHWMMILCKAYEEIDFVCKLL